MNRIRVFLPCVFVFFLCSFAASAEPGQPASHIDSMASLEKRVAGAKPGTTVVLSAGRYDTPCKLKGTGTAEHPIIVKAESIGAVELQNRVELSGEYVTLVGFNFSGKGSLSLNGRGLRVSRCTMSDVGTGKWITCTLDSRSLEIDHCRFENKSINREKRRGCQLIQFVVRNNNEQHSIHHNHFRDIPKGASGNGFETIQLITKGNPFDPPEKACGTRIEYNLFERCNGEAEIISVKSSGNLIRGNVFRECRGSLVLRHGHGNQAIGNFFFGDGEKGAGGVRLQGRNQVVVNNYFQDLSYGIGMMDGTPDKLYMRVENALVAHNTFVNCRKGLRVGINHSKHPNGTVPKDCRIVGNIFLNSQNEADVQAVEFVQNDQPENWTWADNVVQGKRPDGDISFSRSDKGEASEWDTSPDVSSVTFRLRPASAGHAGEATCKAQVSGERPSNGRLSEQGETRAGQGSGHRRRQRLELVESSDQRERQRSGQGLVSGELGISERSGIRVMDPKLIIGVGGIAIPTRETPVSTYDLSTIEWLTSDIFGTPRQGARTIGAIQFPVEGAPELPSKAQGVGPKARQN